MKELSRIEQFKETLKQYFHKEHKRVRENMADCVCAMMRCEKINTAEIARAMHKDNGQSFKTNDMRIYRHLSSSNFQVSDKTWRGYINLLFGMLNESGLQKRSPIQINVDFTSDRNDFLILCASIQFQEQSIPVYFSMRNYPKRANMLDQKKMEIAFFKALRHLLPDSYYYTIVADRGFANRRIVEILKNLHFGYVVRMIDNFRLEYNGKTCLANELEHKDINTFEAFIPAWGQSVLLVKKIKDDAHWLLLVSENIVDAGCVYAQRFAIEKMFKNLKSGGFDLEKLLITQYDRFKRMLFMACIAYSILVVTGLFIKNKKHPIKKNFSLHLHVLSVFSD